MGKHKIIVYALGVVTGLLNGLFGSGGGTIVVPALEKIMGIEEHKAHATALGVILPLSLLSAVIYIQFDEIPWKYLLYIIIGGCAGSFTGAKLLNRVSGLWLHRIFGAFMIAAAVRMILG